MGQFLKNIASVRHLLLSPVATGHCVVSSQLDAPDTEQAPSFSPERQPLLHYCCFLSATAQKTIFFWTVEITLLENGKWEPLLLLQLI